MKFGNWFEKEEIICNNKFTESKDIPSSLCPLFERSGDFDSDIIALCSTLIGISSFGFGTIYSYPLFLDGKNIGTSKNLESSLIFSLIGLQETIETLIEHMDKTAISHLAFKLLNLDIDDYYKVKSNE